MGNGRVFSRDVRLVSPTEEALLARIPAVALCSAQGSSRVESSGIESRRFRALKLSFRSMNMPEAFKVFSLELPTRRELTGARGTVLILGLGRGRFCRALHLGQKNLFCSCFTAENRLGSSPKEDQGSV